MIRLRPARESGQALAWCLVLALVLAPATTVPVPTSVDLTRSAPAPDALDLTARWPLLLDASTRTLAPAGGERALPRAQRRAPAPRRRPCRRFAAKPGRRPRALSLPELGRRQTDGG